MYSSCASSLAKRPWSVKHRRSEHLGEVSAMGLSNSADLQPALDRIEAQHCDGQRLNRLSLFDLSLDDQLDDAFAPVHYEDIDLVVVVGRFSPAVVPLESCEKISDSGLESRFGLRV